MRVTYILVKAGPAEAALLVTGLSLLIEQVEHVLSNKTRLAEAVADGVDESKLRRFVDKAQQLNAYIENLIEMASRGETQALAAFMNDDDHTLN